MYMATRFFAKCTCTKMYKNVVGPPPPPPIMQLKIFRGLRPRAPAAVASEPTPFKNPAHAPDESYFLNTTTLVLNGCDSCIGANRQLYQI